MFKKDVARITVDLPLQLQKQLKAIAASQGKSMREVIIKAVGKELKAINKKNNQSLKIEL